MSVVLSSCRAVHSALLCLLLLGGAAVETYLAIAHATHLPPCDSPLSIHQLTHIPCLPTFTVR